MTFLIKSAEAGKNYLTLAWSKNGVYEVTLTEDGRTVKQYRNIDLNKAKRAFNRYFREVR